MGTFDKFNESKMAGGGVRSYPTGEGRGVARLLTTGFKPNSEVNGSVMTFTASWEVVDVTASDIDPATGKPYYKEGQVYSWVRQFKYTVVKRNGAYQKEIAEADLKGLEHLKAFVHAFTGIEGEDLNAGLLMAMFGATEDAEIAEDHDPEGFAGATAVFTAKAAKSKDGALKKTKDGKIIYNVWFDVHSE